MGLTEKKMGAPLATLLKNIGVLDRLLPTLGF